MPPTLPTCSLRAGATALRHPFLTLSQVRTYKQPRIPNSPIPIPSVTAPHPEIPAYPPGPRQTYHQSNTGLYGTASIRFGNKVSAKNEIKTRRAWRPNVHHKRLWSDSLQVFVRTRVTTRVLRTIDKVGGLDNYLLGIKPARVKELGPWGWRLRWRVMQTDAVRQKLKEERVALGLIEEGEEAQEQEEEALMALEEGGSPEGIMEETSTMLENEEEFTIGKEEDFMKEEKPGKKE
ncbi:hypothetical protein QBC47DRAFT_392358 [Echria macrotheca]|uniref:Large ribosomal subunit protein bL28m n=1 Tax=Echria macrotheca TaxID=438768 RepID=A0AAJ0F1F7_9PEZI|nr:hypothetical protein QBC47DRAFT_392358 [Echria macrotheca]